MYSWVLFLGDNCSCRDMIDKCMRMEDISCDFAFNHTEVREFLGLIQYNLVVINADSLNYDCRRVLKYIKNHRNKIISSTPIIGLTENLEITNKLEFDGILCKTDNLDIFRFKISSYMDFENLEIDRDLIDT